MTRLETTPFRSAVHAVLSGIKLALTLALLYGLAFNLVAIPRASVQILATLTPAEGLFQTLLANAANVYILSMEFALGFGLIAAALAGLVFLLVYALVRVLISQSPRGRALTGLAVSASLALGLHALLWPVDGLVHAILFRSATSYLFWLGLPCLIFVVATTRVSAKTTPGNGNPDRTPDRMADRA